MHFGICEHDTPFHWRPFVHSQENVWGSNALPSVQKIHDYPVQFKVGGHLQVFVVYSRYWPFGQLFKQVDPFQYLSGPQFMHAFSFVWTVPIGHYATQDPYDEKG